VVGLEWSDNPESYAGGSITTGRASHARQVKGYHPDKNGYPGPPVWGLCMRLTTLLLKQSVENILKSETGRKQ